MMATETDVDRIVYAIDRQTEALKELTAAVQGATQGFATFLEMSLDGAEEDEPQFDLAGRPL